MQKFLGWTMVFLSVCGTALAVPAPVPEIDASTGAAALALLSGGMMVLRSRRAKK